MTTAAFLALEARERPRSSNWRSRAAPSAWVARQPKFSTKNPGTPYGIAGPGFLFRRSGCGLCSPRLKAFPAEDRATLGRPEWHSRLLAAAGARSLGFHLGIAVILTGHGRRT